MKAIGMYIFGGSQTIGHLKAGWEIDTVLEMTETMINENAYHFHKNYPNIKIIPPNEITEEYLESIKYKYDLLFSNPPCSGLSTINRNAGVDCKINDHIYEVVNVALNIQPKVFFIENAPTLTSRGLPILKNIAKLVENNYFLLIINDRASNHNVPMPRRRTFVIGFNKNYFKKIPIIHKEYIFTNIKKVFDDINYTYNKEFLNDSDQGLFHFYKYVMCCESFYRAMIRNGINTLPEKVQRNVDKIKEKESLSKRTWDKSPNRLGYNLSPSLTSLTRLIHPFLDRDLFIREYAAIMGYPDDFIFYQNECKTPIVQCIAQGVPVNFIEYISKEIMNSFNTNEFMEGEIVYINQCNPQTVVTCIYNNIEEFNSINKFY